MCVISIKKKFFQVQTLNEQEWEKMEQAQVLASVQHAFDASDTECSQTDDNESIFESMDMLSPSAHTEAQTLAFMLQEQLDAINNEIRLVFSIVPLISSALCALHVMCVFKIMKSVN